MRALITCIGYHFQLHGISPLRRRKHPYLEGQAATILVELVAEDHQDAHREEQWNQRNLCEWKNEAGKGYQSEFGHGTDRERSLKEASEFENVFQLLGFVAYVLQLSIKLRSHDDWIAKEHLPNSLTPRIVPGCLWHHHTVKLALMTFTWGTRPIHSAGHWIHTVDLQFLHLPMGPGTQGQMQLGAGCHTP